MARWDDEGRGRRGGVFGRSDEGWGREGFGRGDLGRREGRPLDRDVDDDDEAQRMRGRPIDEVWVGRRGFNEGRSTGSNERYGWGSNEQRTGGTYGYGADDYSMQGRGGERMPRYERGASTRERDDRGERLGMSQRGYAERFQRDSDDERNEYPSSFRRGEQDRWDDERFSGSRSYWGRGEDVSARGERGGWMRDRDEQGDWGYGSVDRGDRSRWEGGRFVDRRNFGEMGRGAPRGGGQEPGDRSGQRFSENEEHGFREPPYRPGGFGHGQHGRGGFIGGGAGSVYESIKSFFGKGPKNYVRSDERIREDICDRLTEDPMIDASHVDVEVKNGEVRLIGTVSSRHEKRRAEDLVEDVFGVKDVTNNLRVRREGEQPLPGTTTGLQGTTAATVGTGAGGASAGGTATGGTTAGGASQTTARDNGATPNVGGGGTARH